MLDLRPTELAGYMVSADGQVWSMTANWRGLGPRPLAPHVDKWGHAYLRTHRDGQRISVPVARLVAHAHLGPPPEPGARPVHLNGDPTDNRAANLAWAAGTQVTPPPRVVSKQVLQLSLDVLTDPGTQLPDTPAVRAWRAVVAQAAGQAPKGAP